MKFSRLAFATIAVAFLVASCKEAVYLDKTAFQAKWIDFIHHSAISWWYLGENKEAYYIAEKWPLGETIYSIEKQAIKINGVASFGFDSGNKPQNLKYEHIEF